MLHIALYEPEIPPNTGNIMRLCANTGAHLHLIEPLGFTLEEKQLRRAGLDYRDFADVSAYRDYAHFLSSMGERRIFAITTKGSVCYTDAPFIEDDVLLFGPETRGLPDTVLDAIPSQQWLRVPMMKDSRSLNLSNTAAVVLYEGLRQLGFANIR
jgi:tRNA (cytidine/uridine-2'-O-)-methyltransferase